MKFPGAESATINNHELLHDFVTLYKEIKAQADHHERESRRLRKIQAALDRRYGINKNKGE